MAHDFPSDGVRLSVYECKDCFLAWQYPVDRSAEESRAFFEQNYYQTPSTEYFQKGRKAEIARLELGFVESMVGRPESGPPPRLLDIGGGDGSFARLAFAAGWSVTMLDPAARETVECGPGETTLRIGRGTVDYLTGATKFDVVTLFDVIEHVPEPVALIERCRALLDDGGHLIIETGNYQSIDRIVSRRNWWGFQLDHRWYFTPDVLASVLRHAGFTDIETADRVLRPDAPVVTPYGGPSTARLLKGLVRRPWRAIDRLAIHHELRRAAARWPTTCRLGIFAISGRLPRRH